MEIHIYHDMKNYTEATEKTVALQCHLVVRKVHGFSMFAGFFLNKKLSVVSKIQATHLLA